MDSEGNKTGGRKPGVKNKLTRDLKAMIEQALKKKGGVKYLVRQADENPVAFMNLLGRILPKDVSGEVKLTGEFTLIDLLTHIDKPTQPQATETKPH